MTERDLPVLRSLEACHRSPTKRGHKLFRRRVPSRVNVIDVVVFWLKRPRSDQLFFPGDQRCCSERVHYLQLFPSQLQAGQPNARRTPSPKAKESLHRVFFPPRSLTCKNGKLGNDLSGFQTAKIQVTDLMGIEWRTIYNPPHLPWTRLAALPGRWHP